MKKSDLLSAVCGCLVALNCMLLHAETTETILDQENIGSKEVLFNNWKLYRAQTFTVGETGLLSGFDVQLTGVGTVQFQIWNTIDGIPVSIPGTPLAGANITFSTDAIEFFHADISAYGLHVNSGDVLALVQIPPGENSGSWGASRFNQYFDGTVFTTLLTDFSRSWVEQETLDLGFRTYVEVVVPTPLADGDINMDGVVNVADVLIGQQVLTGAATLTSTQLEHGDVAPLVEGIPDPNGMFTLGDLLVIQRKALGLINF